MKTHAAYLRRQAQSNANVQQAAAGAASCANAAPKPTKPTPMIFLMFIYVSFFVLKLYLVTCNY